MPECLGLLRYGVQVNAPGTSRLVYGAVVDVYGPLPLDAVVDVRDFAPGADGTFAAPTALD